MAFTFLKLKAFIFVYLNVISALFSAFFIFFIKLNLIISPVVNNRRYRFLALYKYFAIFSLLYYIKKNILYIN